MLWVRRAARRLRGELGETALRRCAVPRGPAGTWGTLRGPFGVSEAASEMTGEGFAHAVRCAVSEEP